jgi:RNA polymerase sigma-70 factor (ECF subfamily)
MDSSDSAADLPPRPWLGELLGAERKRLFLAAWAVLRRADEADDALQAACVRLARVIPAPLDPLAYALSAVRRAALDHLKLRGRRRESAWSATLDPAAPAPCGPDAELLAELATAVERLDPASREVIDLRLHAELTFQQIADLLDEPLPTVAARYRRAVLRLRHGMLQVNDEPRT